MFNAHRDGAEQGSERELELQQARPQRRVKKSSLKLGIGLFAVVVVIAAVVLTAAVRRANRPLRFSDQSTGLSFLYNKHLQVATLTDQDKKDGFIVRMNDTAKDEQDHLLLSARKDSGFRLISSVSGRTPIDTILDNMRRRYPTTYPDYKQLSQRKFTAAGVDAAEVVFTYKRPDDQTVKEDILILMHGEDEAVYVSFQALAGRYDALQNAYFVPVTKSLAFL